MNLVSFLFFSALGFACFSVCAANASSANTREIQDSITWRKLLHYESSLFTKSGFKSSVLNTEFFLSVDGSENPKAELLAKLNALNAPIDSSKSDQHSLCRFPSRFKFLKKHFLINKEDRDLSDCKGYRNWALDNKVNSISLVFATGYLGNPASYFGHPLLKFNKGLVNGKLLDITLNFGANTPAEENPVVYVLKGLLGGYTAAFSQLQFYFHHTNYTENELRDLWDYELNLSQKEVEIIVDHAWEMLGMRISYLFLSDNCAFRLAELIDLGTGVLLENPYIFYAIPVSLFEGIPDIKKSTGQSIIKSITPIPSRQTRMTKKYLALPPTDQLVTKKLIENPKGITDSVFGSLPASEKSQILETLFDYYAYRAVDDKQNESFVALKQSVVLERLKLPKAEAPKFFLTNESEIPPHQAQGNFTLRAHFIQTKGDINFQEFTVRPALYDYLSLEAARARDSELRVFETTFRYFEKKLSLRKFDIFAVGTLNPARVNLPGVSGLAWKMQLGMLSQKFNCESCLVAGADLGAGYALEANPFFSFYGLATFQVQSELDSYGTAAVRPVLGGFLSWHRLWKTHFNFGTQQFINGLKDHRQLVEIENRFGASRYWDIRLSFLQQDESFTRTSFSYYL